VRAPPSFLRALRRIALTQAVDVLSLQGAMAKRQFPAGARNAPRTGFLFSMAMLRDDLAHLLACLVDGGFFPGRLLMSAAVRRSDQELWPHIRPVATFFQILARRSQAKNLIIFLQFFILSLKIVNFALHLQNINKFQFFY
jgi:hypothetical protein